MPDLLPRRQDGGGTSTSAPAAASAVDVTDTGYDLILLLGQSNMQGAGGTPVALVDVAHPRVYSYSRAGANTGTIVQATDPLQHPNTSSNANVGPGMSFARWYADTAPGNRRVLLVPAAYSGAGFTAGNDADRWDPAASFAAGNAAASLYEATIAQASAALTAAGPNSRITATLWVQGEADINLTASAYRGYLESLIDGLRARLGLPVLPFVIGGMVPEYIATTNGAVAGVHAGTPSRKPYTAYVAGPTGFLYSGDGLGVHYTAAGARELGRRLAAGVAAARANPYPSGAVAAAPPVAPANYVPPTTPPPTGTDYTFAAAPTGWYTNPTLTLTTSGGNLQVPVKTAYETVAPTDVVDLTAHAVTWRLASVPAAAVASTDIYLGVTANPATTTINTAGVTMNYGPNPYVDVRVCGASSRTVDGGVPAAGQRAVGSYRMSSSSGNLVIAYSADGSTWTTLWSGTPPFALTAVKPFLTAGHWDAANPDGVVAVAELSIV